MPGIYNLSLYVNKIALKYISNDRIELRGKIEESTLILTAIKHRQKKIIANFELINIKNIVLQMQYTLFCSTHGIFIKGAHITITTVN